MQKYWQWISLPHSYFSSSVVSDSLRPHESQHARPPCPSPAPGVHPNSCASSRWCHPAISSSVVPFSSCPQSLPVSGSFPMSQLFTWGGQSIHTHTHTQLQEKTRCESQISFYFLPSPQHLLSTPRLGALPRPNLISNSHPSTWLSLWDCILMRQQPSHSIWFCQSTACLVSTPSSIRFSYFLFFYFLKLTRYLSAGDTESIWYGEAQHDLTLNESTPVLCLAGVKATFPQPPSGSLVPLPLSLCLSKSMLLSPRVFPFLPCNLEN